MVEVVRQSCKRMEARNTLRNRLVVWFTGVLPYLSVLPHILIHCVRLYVLFSPTVVEDVVDVASMSGALVSGSHENMP